MEYLTDEATMRVVKETNDRVGVLVDEQHRTNELLERIAVALETERTSTPPTWAPPA